MEKLRILLVLQQVQARRRRNARLLQILAVRSAQRARQRRTQRAAVLWMIENGLVRQPRVKSDVWIKRVVPTMTDARFRRFFRVSRRVFKMLLRRLYPKAAKTRGRKAHPPAIRLGVALMRLATTCSVPILSECFGISDGAVVSATDEFVHKVVTQLKDGEIRNQIVYSFVAVLIHGSPVQSTSCSPPVRD